MLVLEESSISNSLLNLTYRRRRRMMTRAALAVGFHRDTLLLFSFHVYGSNFRCLLLPLLEGRWLGFCLLLDFHPHTPERCLSPPPFGESNPLRAENRMVHVSMGKGDGRMNVLMHRFLFGEAGLYLYPKGPLSKTWC